MNFPSRQPAAGYAAGTRETRKCVERAGEKGGESGKSAGPRATPGRRRRAPTAIDSRVTSDISTMNAVAVRITIVSTKTVRQSRGAREMSDCSDRIGSQTGSA